MTDARSLVEVVSRFLPLKQNGAECHARCCFHADEGESLRVGLTWRCLGCAENEVNGSDAAGFLMSWSGCSRDEAEHQLGNGGLPPAMPVQVQPLRRACFWGLRALLDSPKGINAIVWVHWVADGVHFGREHLAEGRVHLGLCSGRPIDDESISLLDGRSCILIPDNRESSFERMDELASKLYAAGHAKVRYVRVQDQEDCYTWPSGLTPEQALTFVQEHVSTYPNNGAAQDYSQRPNRSDSSDEPPLAPPNASPSGPHTHAVSASGLEGGAPIDQGAARNDGVDTDISNGINDTRSARNATILATSTLNAAPTPAPAVASGHHPLVAPPIDTAGVGDAPIPKRARKADSSAAKAPRSADQPPGHHPAKGNGSTSLTTAEAAQAYADQTRAEVLGQMVYRKASSIKMRATDWLWPGKIPLGEICVIQGDPGLGKSQITASLCAIITTGGLWPVTRERCDAGSVVILSAEDSAPKTIVPRLKAAGADLDRVTLLQAIKHEHGTRGVSLLADMLALDMLLAEHDNPMAVIVDPISAYQDTVGSNAKTHDSHKNTDVRSLLRPVAELVDRHNVTMILINHLTKGTGRAITRGQGNMAFVAGPRAVWQVSKDKDDPRKRLFLPVKNNLADDSEETGLSFSVESMDLGEDDQGKAIKTSRILWNDERVTISADEASGYDSMSQDERGSVADAQEFLREALSEGRLKAKDVERLAKTAGHNASTLGRAKRALGVLSEKEGFAADTVWYWRLKG